MRLSKTITSLRKTDSGAGWSERLQGMVVLHDGDIVANRRESGGLETETVGRDLLITGERQLHRPNGSYEPSALH